MIAAYTVPEALHIYVKDTEKLENSQISLVIAFTVGQNIYIILSSTLHYLYY